MRRSKHDADAQRTHRSRTLLRHADEVRMDLSVPPHFRNVAGLYCCGTPTPKR